MKKGLIITLALFSLLATASTSTSLSKQSQQPNLIVIMTDEHNFRTLGCYRDLMSDEQAYVWGKDVAVETPNLDRLAEEGAIAMNYYSSSPVCTPSRASFVSGLYPQATDSYKNNIPMNDKVTTFAQVLQKEGYATSYVGKWHLDGDAKPGFAPKRKFGFEDNRYMFNRGHWKKMEDGAKEPAVEMHVQGTDENSFATDYLTTKFLEILERDKASPFCAMLSIPDPHTPNTVREPYTSMYDNLHFKEPKTMQVSKESMPVWAISKKEYVTELKQNQMQDYFGMVKCIDDNVGRILAFLEKNKLADNTIIVFTSDHGDMMGEHHRHNKGVAYETSARIPFLIRYPQAIPQGKIIHKAFTTTDFTPTILGIMNAPAIKNIHGLNAANDFTSKEKVVVDERLTYMTGTASNWVAAVNNRYKLVLSVTDKPWLFDLEKDPDELVNFYNKKGYEKISKEMKNFLLDCLEKYDDRILLKKDGIKL